MAKAIVDRMGGRAVVIEPKRTWDGAEKIYVLDYDKCNCWPQDGSAIHLGMFLQPAVTELTEYDAGDYPYEELQSYLISAHREESTLLMILLALSADSTRSIRKLAAEAALENLADEETKDWITSRLNATPLTAIADIAGVPDLKLKSFLQPFAAG